jgi:hydroxymethylpyrimidine pyrophosphatase-like HAD family hydrolase
MTSNQSKIDKSPKVAFDLDGTLIYQCGEKEDTPRYEVIQFLKLFHQFGCEIYLWSGSGVEKATEWAKKLGISDIVKVVEKGSFVPDITIDDLDDITLRTAEKSLGKVNIFV